MYDSHTKKKKYGIIISALRRLIPPSLHWWEIHFAVLRDGAARLVDVFRAPARVGVRVAFLPSVAFPPEVDPLLAETDEGPIFVISTSVNC